MENSTSSRRDLDGCYKEFFEAECQDEVDEERLVVGQDLPDGVFAVERLVTARKNKHSRCTRQPLTYPVPAQTTQLTATEHVVQ